MPEQRVVVTNFDMPFGSMVGFIIKWTLASIPAMMILGLLFTGVWLVAFAIFAGLSRVGGT